MSLLLVLMLTLSIGVAETVEPSGEGPASVSNITSVMDVPLITLSNGVQLSWAWARRFSPWSGTAAKRAAPC